MAGLRELFRAARELYLDCNRERLLAEACLDQASAHIQTGHTYAPRLNQAYAREAAMREASRVLVRHINPPDDAAG